jgi:RNA polymerase sigma factor (sigma-70 family)
MSDHDLLAERFEENRDRLRAVAYRMLGSQAEADDAVQEAWLRLARTDAEGVDNLAGWLTTVVARVCLNMLQQRTTRRERPLDVRPEDPAAPGPDPEHEALLADAVGPALLVVLDTLTPAERLAFVLHDLFAVPFEEIAPIVGRSPTASRQLASRARRRVQGAEPPDGDQTRQREVVAAFLTASREGDFAALLSILDPDVVVRADGATVATGAEPRVRGAREVAGSFSGRARAARPALVDGVPGLVWMAGGQVRVVFDFTIVEGRIVSIDLISDAAVLAELDVVL